MVYSFRVGVSGAQRTVAYVPDPRNNRIVRLTPEDAPWSPPPTGHFTPSKFATPVKG